MSDLTTGQVFLLFLKDVATQELFSVIALIVFEI